MIVNFLVIFLMMINITPGLTTTNNMSDGIPKSCIAMPTLVLTELSWHATSHTESESGSISPTHKQIEACNICSISDITSSGVYMKGPAKEGVPSAISIDK